MKKRSLLQLFWGMLFILLGSFSESALAQSYDIPTNIINKSDYNCISNLVPGNVFHADTSWTYPKRYKSGTNGYTGSYYVGFTTPLVADVNNDGKPEIICLGTPRAYNAPDLGALPVDRIDILDGAGNVKLSIPTPSFTSASGSYHGPPSHMVVAKASNSDTYPCIYLTTTGTTAQRGQVFCYQMGPDYTYSIRWQNSTTENSIRMFNKDVTAANNPDAASYNGTTYPNFMHPLPLVGDLNGDGIAEIVVYNKVYRGTDGEIVATTEPINKANVGRKWWYGYQYGDEENYLGLMTLVDIDGDGKLEIAAGNKVYSPRLSGNTFLGNCDITTYDFQSSVTGLSAAEQSYYGDGFTGAADIDGDGQIEVVVIGTAFGNYRGGATNRIRIYAWKPDLAAKTGFLLGAMTLRPVEWEGYFGMPFIGDVNKKTVPFSSEGGITRLLPEICFTTGHFNTGEASVESYWTDRIHPQSTISSAVSTTGLRRLAGNNFAGFVLGLTYDPSSTDKEFALKVSWALQHTDRSQMTGITTFDFNNAGYQQVVYRDEISLRVINASTNTDLIPLEYNETSNPDVVKMAFRDITSYTGYEVPVVADVNGDGSADFITYGSTVNYYANGQTAASLQIDNGNPWSNVGRLFIFEGKGAGFAATLPVWNQFNYSPLLINKDLSLPTKPSLMTDKYRLYDPPESPTYTEITPYNGTFLQQPLVTADNYYPIIPIPDAIVSEFRYLARPTENQTKVSFKVRNAGDASISTLSPISFYTGTITPGNKIITIDYHSLDTPLSGAIYPGDEVTLNYTLNGDFRGKTIWIRLVDDGSSFPATGYYECDTLDNELSISNLYANGDNKAIGLGQLDSISILDNDLKYCISDSIRINILSQSNPSLGKYVMMNNKIYYRAGRTVGTDIITYNFMCSDSISNDTMVIITINGPEPTIRTLTWNGSVSLDWNNLSNWTDATSLPDYMTEVIIPEYGDLSGVRAYPELKTTDMATCRLIHFKNGAETAKPMYLAYDSAKVQLKLYSNRWNMVAPPLRDMYSGDYILGNDQFRQIPAKVYQKEYQSANLNTGTIISEGSWSVPYRALDSHLPLGTGLAVWLDYADETSYGTSRLMTDAEAFVFPNNNTVHYYYYMDPNAPNYQHVSGSVPVPRTVYSKRFIYDGAAGETSLKAIELPVNSAFATVMVANPWMSHIDYIQLQGDNADKIDKSFKILNTTSTGAAYYEVYGIDNGDVISTEGGGVSTGFKIPPMQSFIADKISGASFPTLTFNPTASVTAPTIGLRSSTSKRNMFRIQVNDKNDVRNSGIVILQSPEASNSFIPGEDVFTTLPDPSSMAAILYCITDDGTSSGIATSINKIENLTESVELGVRSKALGDYSFRFTDLDMFKGTGEIWLEDKALKDEKGASYLQNIMTNPEYKFTMNDKVIEGRFYIRFNKTATGFDKAVSSASGIRIYSEDRKVTISTSSDNLIREIQIVNVQGQTVMSQSGVYSDYVTLTLPDQNTVYIVRVTAEKSQESKKVIVY